jgi:hypothetical protein
MASYFSSSTTSVATMKSLTEYDIHLFHDHDMTNKQKLNKFWRTPNHSNHSPVKYGQLSSTLPKPDPVTRKISEC